MFVILLAMFLLVGAGSTIVTLGATAPSVIPHVVNLMFYLISAFGTLAMMIGVGFFIVFIVGILWLGTEMIADTKEIKKNDDDIDVDVVRSKIRDELKQIIKETITSPPGPNDPPEPEEENDKNE